MSRNYVLKPKRKTRGVTALLLGLLVLAAVSFYLSALIPQTRAAGQFASVIFLLLFIQITTKYLLTEYEYAIEEKTLHFSCRQGRKIKNLGSVVLSDRHLLMTKKAFSAQKKKFSLSHRLSFCQNLFSPDIFVLLCPEEKGYVAVFFEPDEVFLQLLGKRIEKDGKRE